MKFIHRPNQARWHKHDAWKKSAYAFTPNQTHFGELTGFADDIVNAGEGFGMHPTKTWKLAPLWLRVHRLTKTIRAAKALFIKIVYRL